MPRSDRALVCARAVRASQCHQRLQCFKALVFPLSHNESITSGFRIQGYPLNSPPIRERAVLQFGAIPMLNAIPKFRGVWGRGAGGCVSGPQLRAYLKSQSQFLPIQASIHLAHLLLLIKTKRPNYDRNSYHADVKPILSSAFDSRCALAPDLQDAAGSPIEQALNLELLSQRPPWHYPN